MEWNKLPPDQKRVYEDLATNDSTNEGADISADHENPEIPNVIKNERNENDIN